MPLARCFIALSVFESFLKTGKVLQFGRNFPADTQIKMCVLAPEKGGLWLVIDSAQFPAVPPGGMLTEQPIVIRDVQFLEDIVPPLPSRTTTLEGAPAMGAL